MVKASETNTNKITAGCRIEFDNKEFVPMLDSKGNERIGSRGTLVKYGYVRRQGIVLRTLDEKVEVSMDGRQYSQWLKHSESPNITVL